MDNDLPDPWVCQTTPAFLFPFLSAARIVLATAFVVVRCAFQILLAGICVIRIDYLDQTHQHFWIGQAIAITRIMFSRFHSLPEGLQHQREKGASAQARIFICCHR